MVCIHMSFHNIKHEQRKNETHSCDDLHFSLQNSSIFLIFSLISLFFFLFIHHTYLSFVPYIYSHNYLYDSIIIINIIIVATSWFLCAVYDALASILYSYNRWLPMRERIAPYRLTHSLLVSISSATIATATYESYWTTKKKWHERHK